MTASPSTTTTAPALHHYPGRNYLVRRTLLAAQDALGPAQDLAREAKAYAARHGLFMREDGRCNRPPRPLVANDDPAVLRDWYAYQQDVAAAEQAEALAQQALQAAGEADQAAQWALLRAWNAAADGSTRDRADLALVSEVTNRPAPAAGTAPAQVAAWWASLSPAAQGLLIARHPDQVGNLDGVPVWARDKANRTRLRDGLEGARADLAAAEARFFEARAAATGRGKYEALRPLITARDEAQRRLEMLEAVDRALSDAHDRTLMLLDTQMPGRAAIGIGDVDNAEHVAVLVPGMDSYVTNYMGTITDNAERLRQVAGDALEASGHERSVAAVAWIGYHAPTIPDVALTDRAEAAVPQLTATLDGIEAVRAADGRAVHLTTLGHSYGSLVSGMTAASYTAMDDLVLFGSPGAGVQHATEFALPADHVFVGEARGDIVADLNRFGGVDPAAASFGAVPFQTDGGAHPIGGQTGEVTGHSDYYQADSESLWNMVSVVIDRPDAVTVGHTFGAGDQLWTK